MGLTPTVPLASRRTRTVLNETACGGALFIAPTRELAQQIQVDWLAQLLKSTKDEVQSPRKTEGTVQKQHNRGQFAPSPYNPTNSRYFIWYADIEPIIGHPLWNIDSSSDVAMNFVEIWTFNY